MRSMVVLGVGQVSWPLDHGAAPVKWSHRELHPDFHRAEVASSFWTMTPKGGSRGTRTHKRHWPPPVFRTGSSSGRMASVFKLRRLESNQHEDVQSVSSYR